MIRVSVITVCLNAAMHIEGALRSVMDQTYPEVELVVIDGGSSDGTVDIVGQYRDRIGYFVSEPDDGLYDAMNKGARAATGDVLFFLNADDRFCDDRVIGDVARAFQDHPGVELIYGDIVWDTPGGRIREVQPEKITPKRLARQTIFHQTVFTRKGLFLRTGGFSRDHSIVSDYEWLLKVFLVDMANVFHLHRDICMAGTGGVSNVTRWEQERLRVMKMYYTPFQVFRWRTLPRGLDNMFHDLLVWSRKVARFLLGRAIKGT